MTATATTTQPQVTTWTIDPAHTSVEFAVRHMMISTVKGRFADVQGTLTFDEADPTRSTVDVTIATASVDTRSEQRDGHLKSADFFDVEKFPAIRFTSTRVTKTGSDSYDLVGNLTIRDVTREVTLKVEDQGRGTTPWGQVQAGFTASTRVDRKDFGLTWNQALEAGGVLVADEVKISVEVEFTKAA
ncbi:MAG TPA: YceI family protein [Gemmatimonadaceae bacterium]